MDWTQMLEWMDEMDWIEVLKWMQELDWMKARVDPFTGVNGGVDEGTRVDGTDATFGGLQRLCW